jgi:hypothetical protein
MSLLTHHISSAHSRPVAANSATGFGDPSNKRRNGAATALFCCVTPASSMAGVSGRLRPGRVPLIPVRQPGTSVTLNRLATIGGGSQLKRIPS